MNEEIMSFKRFCDYLKVSNVTGLKILNSKNCDFAFKCGRIWKISKKKLDEQIENSAKNHINFLDYCGKMYIAE